MEILHDEVEMVAVLKAVMHLDDERMFSDGSENEAFKPDMIDLTLVDHILLLQFFHSVKVAIDAMTNKKNLTKTSLTDFTDDIVMCHAHRVTSFADIL